MLKHIIFNKFYKLILYSLLTYFILCIIYPENFLFSDKRFTSSHTVANFYQSALFHAKYINNLDFNFWNFFDQANTTFYHLAQGFYNLTSLIEGLTYNLLAIFSPENFFSSFHFFFIKFILIILQTSGIILILQFYKIKKNLHLIIILFINILITSVVSLGYEAGIIISLSPILLFYLLNFLERNDLISLISFLVFFILIFSQIPLLSLSYFFSPFHFLFFLYLCVATYNFFFKKKYFDKKYINIFIFNKNFNFTFILLISSVLIIILFNLSFFWIANDTHALTGSIGYDGTNASRLDNFLNPVKFFKTYIPNARCIFESYFHNFSYKNYYPECSISNWFSFFFNFNKNEWLQAPVFLGLTSIIISLFGLFFSRRKEKWYFFFTIFFIIALQGPRDVIFTDINFYANVFTSLLNPFSFLIQHTHMIVLMAPVFLIPLFIMGIEALYEKLYTKEILKKIIFALLLFLILIFLITVKKKIGLSVIIFYILIIILLFLSNLLSKYKNNIITLPILFICFLIDSYALNVYFSKAPRISSEKFLPVNVLNDINNRKIKSYIDNPNPFNTSLSLEIISNKPIVKLDDRYSSKENLIYKNLSFPNNLYFGEFYKTNFLYRVLENPKIYEIRHKSYKSISEYKNLDYFKNNMLLVSFFENTINFNDARLIDYFQNQNLFNYNIFISDNSLQQIKKTPQISNETSNSEIIEVYINKNDLKPIRVINENVLYKFSKPKNMPNYINGSIFSSFLMPELSVNNQILQLSHDNLFFENTFNIDSTENNFIYFLINKNLVIKKITLRFHKNLLVENLVQKNESFLFKINIINDGWLLIKFPFDKNWQIFLDGKKTKVYKANEYWMAVEVSKNNKLMEVKYSLSKYGINQISLFFYYLSMIYIVIFLLRFNSEIKKK
jgi:hypothetical protein